MADPLIERARAAFRQGRATEARALVARNGTVEALEIEAAAAMALGDGAGAERALRQAIVLAPDKRWPVDDLARLLLGEGRIGEGEAVLRQALVADHANPNAHAMLGMLFAGREMLVAADRHLAQAIALAGRLPDLLGALGRVLARQGRLDEAEPLLREAMAGAPDALLPVVHLAELLEQAQRLDEAATLLDRAEAIAARTGQDVTLQRATLLGRTERWRDGLALLDAVATPSGTALLARGRLRERAGRDDEAWADFIAGKAALAAGRRYPRDAVDALERALAGFFTPARLVALPRAAVRRDVPQPVFVLGFPRSGTTLTEQLLASHSAIRPGGELPFVPALVEFAAGVTGARVPLGLGTLLAADQRHLPTLFRDFYLAQAEADGLLAAGAAFFTDKMPLSEIYLPLIRLAFPEAPVIRVERHPLDVMVSTMAHDLTHGFNCGYRLEDAAHHFAAVDRLAARWRALGIGWHTLRYEALIADQAGETAALMAALGLAAEPAQARFHESRRMAPTPSYAQVQAPLNDRSIGRWRRHAAALAPVRETLAPAIARGGYAA